MATRAASLLLVICASVSAPALASEVRPNTADQHLEWSRRVDQNRDPYVTGSTGGSEDVYVDVRQRQCLPARSPADGTFVTSTGADAC
jgi:hypothetical protein